MCVHVCACVSERDFADFLRDKAGKTRLTIVSLFDKVSKLYSYLEFKA